MQLRTRSRSRQAGITLIGIARADVEVLGAMEPVLTVTGFCIRPFVARLVPGAAFSLDEFEVAEVFEAPLRVFGRFERHFLERLSETLPQSVACMWTGAKVVSPVIRLDQARTTLNRVNRRLILWDNYPVNDLSMSDEMHLGPLTGRDPRLPEAVYGYLNNPLLQESLSYIPLATCFEYARNPHSYDAEQSWRRAVEQRFGADALSHWRALRRFCERDARRNNKDIPLRVNGREAGALRSALGYVRKHHRKGWARELKPWIQRLEKTLTAAKP